MGFVVQVILDWYHPKSSKFGIVVPRCEPLVLCEQSWCILFSYYHSRHTNSQVIWQRPSVRSLKRVILEHTPTEKAVICQVKEIIFYLACTAFIRDWLFFVAIIWLDYHSAAYFSHTCIKHQWGTERWGTTVWLLSDKPTSTSWHCQYSPYTE